MPLTPSSVKTRWHQIQMLLSRQASWRKIHFLISNSLYGWQMIWQHWLRQRRGATINKLLFKPMKIHSVNACMHYLAPVPLSIFRSNSKFDENSERSSFEYTRPITTIFCTRHDSDTVVACAKYSCDRARIFYTRVFWIFIEFRIRSKYV